jgi:GNAT superfamily N-acetyltransferase
MALVRTGYELQFEEVSKANPAYGRACLLPWDAELFGFPVATYKIGAESIDEALRGEFTESLASWLGRNRVEVCACVIPAANAFWKVHLPRMGFVFVDFGLRANLNSLQTASLPKARTELRRAERSDWEDIQAIAAQSFHHGRYHADPLFPRELADRRYRQWVGNALAGEYEFDRVYVMGKPGNVQGFYHLTIEGEVSDLRLAAVRPKLQGTVFGVELYLSALHLLKQSGVRRVITNFSAGNTSAMNLLAMLGFRFAEPEAIYHWHAEGFGLSPFPAAII